LACNEGEKPVTENRRDTVSVVTTSVMENVSENTLSFKTFTVSGGWGYDIFVNDKLYIHQPGIPAISGDKSFVSEEEAGKVANLMILKIKNNTMPPAVAVSELDSLGIQY